MFRDDKQRNEVCRTLLASLRLDSYWTAHGPTEIALEWIEAKSSPLSHGEFVLLQVALDMWNGDAKTPLSEIAYVLDGERLRLVGSLLFALAGDALDLDRWLATRGRL